MPEQTLDNRVTNARDRATMDSNRIGEMRHLPWQRLLYRLLSLTDGCHVITVVKDGEELQWNVDSRKLEK